MHFFKKENFSTKKLKKSAVQKAAYTVSTPGLSTLDATNRPLKIWNLCQYIINRTRQQFTFGDLSCRGAGSSDYNAFYSILTHLGM